MNDIMDPVLANKIECFMARKRMKYGISNAIDYDDSTTVCASKTTGSQKQTPDNTSMEPSWIF